MEITTTSSAIIVKNLLIAMLTNFQVSDEQVERELTEYFQEHPGGGGSSSYFVYDRNSVTASNWIIDHNLNKYPQVTLIDDEGNLFEADIFYNSLNQVTVVFAEPTAGKAVLT